MLTYSQLTSSQKKHIANGCGGKGSFINPPDLIFEEDCNEHDFDYWLGKDSKDKLIADKKYYGRMKKRIKEEVKSYVKKAHYHIWAFAYYRFVLRLGNGYFYYSDKYKTMEDLVKEIREADVR